MNHLRNKIEDILETCITTDWIWDGVDEKRITEFNKEKAVTELLKLFEENRVTNYQYTEHQIHMHSQHCFCQVHDCPYCMDVARSQRDNPELWGME